MPERKHDDVSALTQLGSKETEYLTEVKPDILETFPNKFFERDYVVEFETSEFTSNCPRTGQPDFATISIKYRPAEKCIETKSLKLYLFSYRNEKSFMETIANNILEDLVACCNPNWMGITASFNARGGITTDVYVSYGLEDE